MHSDGWNFADVWDTAAAVIPQQICQIQGERKYNWQQFERRASGLARALLDAGLGEQSKVAQYLYNCPEYLESVYASFKAGLVPVNTNYRYEDRELLYLWDNSDTEAIVFHGTFSDRLERLRKELDRIKLFIWVDDGSGDRPSWALDYEDLACSVSDDDHGLAPWGRSGDHIYMLYTGGTTGMPKGVMWRQDDLYRVFALSTGGDPGEPDLAIVAKRLSSAPGPVGLPACPLMHGTGAITAFQILNLGGLHCHPEEPQFRSNRTSRHYRARKSELGVDRGGCFRKAHSRCVGCQPRSVGPLQPQSYDLFWCDVEPEDKEGSSSAPPGNATGRRIFLL